MCDKPVLLEHFYMCTCVHMSVLLCLCVHAFPTSCYVGVLISPYTNKNISRLDFLLSCMGNGYYHT